MLGWRRKNDGFVWHKHVRTTILLRRKARRDRIEQAKAAAVEGAKASGAKAVDLAQRGAQNLGAGAKASGSMAANLAGRGARGLAARAARAGAMMLTAVREGARRAGAAARASAPKVAAAARPGVEALRPGLDILGRPGVALPLLLSGLVATASALARPAMGRGLDREAQIALLIGALCLLAALLPRLSFGWAPAAAHALGGRLGRVPTKVRAAIGWGMAAFAALGLALVVLPGRISAPTINLSSLTPFGSGPPITGRARVLGADTLGVGSTVVRLDGIEAPDRAQTCRRIGNRHWRCGEAAVGALSRLAHGHQVRCERAGTDAHGVVRATCYVGKTDLGAALVKGGHAFAHDGVLARYGGEQKTARAAHAGLWSSDTPERPAQWRARLWETAKARAPDGCPIKGTVERRRGHGGKVYHLPWQPRYAQVRVRSSRGGRWFCSEQEAAEAGFHPVGQGRASSDG